MQLENACKKINSNLIFYIMLEKKKKLDERKVKNKLKATKLKIRERKKLKINQKRKASPLNVYIFYIAYYYLFINLILAHFKNIKVKRMRALNRGKNLNF
jgi:hypothetical protein